MTYVDTVEAAVAKARPGAFAVTGYASERAARMALLDREADGVLVPQSGKLIVAGAAGRTPSVRACTSRGRRVAGGS
ncbi:hypothetical protein AB0M95_05420 [Sphaerisporangium sp. NPDC051017]|uniref:hypothetical protein n=1 Tax=Sphaerisporangium sp. NPDC051017 TaxID=3154636 RepID=UPI00342BA69D